MIHDTPVGTTNYCKSCAILAKHGQTALLHTCGMNPPAEKQEAEGCTRCKIKEDVFKKSGVLCDLETSNGAHSFQVVSAIPSGVTGWKDYGMKYGYWDFFESQTLQDSRTRLIEEVEKLRIEVLPTHAEENGYGCALDDIINLLKQPK